MPKIKGPSIQWYYKQWLGDQKVLAMDWDANGMHFWLINLSLQEDPAGTIPNDTALIRRWLHNPSDDVWRRVQPQIFSAWSLVDGRWHQGGTKATAERQKAYSESRTEAANARWAKRDAYALHMQYEKDALQSSTSSLITTTKLNTKATTPQAAFVLPDFIPRKPWDAWIEMRKKKRATPTQHAMQLAIERLVTLAASGSDPGEVLNQSTFRNWTGLFEVHQSPLSTGQGQPERGIHFESKRERLLRESDEDQAADNG